MHLVTQSRGKIRSSIRLLSTGCLHLRTGGPGLRLIALWPSRGFSLVLFAHSAGWPHRFFHLRRQVCFPFLLQIADEEALCLLAKCYNKLICIFPFNCTSVTFCGLLPNVSGKGFAVQGWDLCFCNHDVLLSSD